MIFIIVSRLYLKFRSINLNSSRSVNDLFIVYLYINALEYQELDITWRFNFVLDTQEINLHIDEHKTVRPSPDSMYI